jgi:hypothetical protein
MPSPRAIKKTRQVSIPEQPKLLCNIRFRGPRVTPSPIITIKLKRILPNSYKGGRWSIKSPSPLFNRRLRGNVFSGFAW